MTDETHEIDKAMGVLNHAVAWVNNWRDLGGFLSADITDDGDWLNVRIEMPRLGASDNMGRMCTRALMKAQPDWEQLSHAIRMLGGPSFFADGEVLH